MGILRAVFLFSVIALSGCGAEVETQLAQLQSHAQAVKHGRALVETSLCQRVVGGVPGDGPLALQLSKTHASFRYFGAHGALSEVDHALSEALGDQPLTELALTRYARNVGACVAAAPLKTLGPASVTLVSGNVAVITPGTGPVTLPPGTAAVALDLRGLPADPGLWAALKAAVGAALATPIPRATHMVREHFGLTDGSYFPAANIYFNAVVDEAYGILGMGAPELIEATGSADLPISLLVGEQLAPAAAEMAGTLRLANRAWLLGQSVFADVAESRWSAVNAQGLVYRAVNLYNGSARWPDEITADSSCISLTAIASLPPRPPSRKLGPSTRADLADLGNMDTREAADLTIPNQRAALMTAHGTARLFSPVIDFDPQNGSAIDTSLVKLMDEVSASPDASRDAFEQRLERLAWGLHDNHANAVLGGPLELMDNQKGSQKYLLAQTESINGVPVIRRSAVPGVNPGDTVVAVNDTPIEVWLQQVAPYLSASSAAGLDTAASDRLRRLESTTRFTLRAADGGVHTVAVAPASQAGFCQAPVCRPSGYLGDLGAPDLYYLNLDFSVTSWQGDLLAALNEAQGAAGLIIDMRSYPWIDPYDAASRFINGPFLSPQFGWPIVSVDGRSYYWELDPLGPPPGGPVVSPQTPIVLLVGEHTESAGENLAMMLTAAHRVTVVGRDTVGTNGNITGAQLLGDFTLPFTGLGIRFSDGSRFYGVGIVPDVRVTLTAGDFAAGRDPELLKAVELLPH